MIILSKVLDKTHF